MRTTLYFWIVHIVFNCDKKQHSAVVVRRQKHERYQKHYSAIVFQTHVSVTRSWLCHSLLGKLALVVREDPQETINNKPR